mmetsp:Transcript_110019/g.350433  ORF Transcript_110019/g.350433 Transcript_110019/m.350433 type:complete len:337 (+) Transcript_110019:484-1494(+)
MPISAAPSPRCSPPTCCTTPCCMRLWRGPWSIWPHRGQECCSLSSCASLAMVAFSMRGCRLRAGRPGGSTWSRSSQLWAARRFSESTSRSGSVGVWQTGVRRGAVCLGQRWWLRGRRPGTPLPTTTATTARSPLPRARTTMRILLPAGRGRRTIPTTSPRQPLRRPRARHGSGDRKRGAARPGSTAACAGHYEDGVSGKQTASASRRRPSPRSKRRTLGGALPQWCMRSASALGGCKASCCGRGFRVVGVQQRGPTSRHAPKLQNKQRNALRNSWCLRSESVWGGCKVGVQDHGQTQISKVGVALDSRAARSPTVRTTSAMEKKIVRPCRRHPTPE